MNKKGILFTITTFLLLWSLIIINMAYVERNNELQNLVLTTTAGDKLKYLEDDVLHNLLEDILDVSFNSTRESGNVTFTMQGFSLLESKDHGALVADYVNYIVGNYSSLNNIEIDIINLSSSFELSPYESLFTINKSEFSMTSNQPEKIKAILVEIVVNKSVGQVLINSTPFDGGNVSLNVIVLDENDNSLLGDTFALLDPTDNNNPFRVTFSGNSSIEIEFGDHLATDGSLSIITSNLAANITSLELTFQDTTEELKVTSGFINIDITDKSISKRGESVLFLE